MSILAELAKSDLAKALAFKKPEPAAKTPEQLAAESLHRAWSEDLYDALGSRPNGGALPAPPSRDDVATEAAAIRERSEAQRRADAARAEADALKAQAGAAKKALGDARLKERLSAIEREADRIASDRAARGKRPLERGELRSRAATKIGRGKGAG